MAPHHGVGLHEALWTGLYSADGKLDGQTDHWERGRKPAALVLPSLKQPISWHKVKGGSEFERINHLRDSGRFRTGSATKRSAAELDTDGFEELSGLLELGETFRKERTAQKETAKAAAKRGRRER